MNSLFSALLLAISCPLLPSARAEAADQAFDWAAFMKGNDMTFSRLPRNWTEAPHFGNASIGSMLYQAGNVIRLQVFRADVQDHRDDSYGWPAYSRPRLQIGHFELHPAGKLTGCSWRKDLWNAELTGTITSDKGEIKIRHFTHAEDMAIITELTPSEGEKGCTWTWHPIAAASTRPGYPAQTSQIPKFAKEYGEHYAKTLQVAKANPPGRLELQGDVSVWIQDLLAGGQYATAWTDREAGGVRTRVITIANSYPAATSARTAVADIGRFSGKTHTDEWRNTHRTWWHDYFKHSFISLPDPKLQALYWQTIYRFGCTSRTGRAYVDTSGLWFQGGNWCYTTTDWNTEAAHWPVYAANHLEQGRELLERFHSRKEELVKAVRPEKWQSDSAYLPIEVAGDLIGNREQDMRYFHLVGLLPWHCHNFWMQYRYSMDDAMLREKIFPLLRRGINLYLHLLENGPDGKLHLPPTYSPETKVVKDANFDLALLKWGCHTLLKSCKRLRINDPLIPRWKEVIAGLPDYPVDENGYRLGADATSSSDHRHGSHLLMIYPLHLVNIEQEGTADVLTRSYRRFDAIKGLPAMVQTHAAPMAADLGLAEEALRGLKRQQNDLFPNGMWYTPPCLESSLGMANTVQQMLIQSWSDPAKDESGPIRVFPACPGEWKDVTFHDLRTEGAFLVSAQRQDGATRWVRIKSLAGEPCRVRPDLVGEIQLKGSRPGAFKQTSQGTYLIDLKKGEEVLLYTGGTVPEVEDPCDAT